MALASGAAAAAPPTIVTIDPGYSFTEYAGTAAVGQGDVNIRSTLFYIDEKVADGWKSWYLFFDPGSPLQALHATLHFDQPIYAVLTTKAELDFTNTTYGNTSVTYGTSKYIGLEPRDSASWESGGKDLTLDWNAIHPGDHIRVLVAVPEPATYCMFTAGLLVLGVTLRRLRVA